MGAAAASTSSRNPAKPDRTSEQMVRLYEDWLRQYPIVSIEDGMAEGDWDGWQTLTRELGARVQLVGDDVFVTNPEILRRGIADGVGNALLVKLNQIGTVTETLDAVAMARDAGYATHHLASLGRDRGHDDRGPRGRHGAGQIKTGSASRSDRVAKYNQLLRIEEELGAGANTPAAARSRAELAEITRSRSDRIRQSVIERCTSSFCSATARAPGTRRTGSPAGPTSICPSAGREEAREAGRLLQRGRLRVRRRLHVGAQARDPDAVDRARRARSAVDSGRRRLAAERAPLRRAAGTEQGGDRGEARRGAGQDLAPQLRHPAAAARRRTIRAIRRAIRATRPRSADDCRCTESLKDTVARFLPYWHDTIAPAIKAGQARR